METIAECSRGNAIRTDQQVLWSINTEHVEGFCDDNGEAPLSDDEMEELRVILAEDFDCYAMIVEALHRLRGGARRE